LWRAATTEKDGAAERLPHLQRESMFATHD